MCTSDYNQIEFPTPCLPSCLFPAPRVYKRPLVSLFALILQDISWDIPSLPSDHTEHSHAFLCLPTFSFSDGWVHMLLQLRRL